MSEILNSPVTVLQGVGEARRKQYERLGILTLSDLIYHFPRAYENRGDVRLLSECVAGVRCSVLLTVGTVPKKAVLRGGMELLKFTAFDKSGVCEIVFFNQNYLASKFPLGAEFRFYGQAERVDGHFRMTSPAYEIALGGTDALPALVPIYPLTEGLGKNRIAADVRAALDVAGGEPRDYLPESIRERYSLAPLSDSLRAIHNPESFEELSRAKRRLVFDELLTFSLGMAITRERRAEYGAPRCDIGNPEEAFSLFPYELTDDQKSAVRDIAHDMARETPMSRIVVGDVGCGKTAVAICAMYIALRSGRQAALMAPTEILARQHYSEIAPLLAFLGYRTELLVGSLSAREKKRIKESLLSEGEGRADVLIGTHALLSEGVEFSAPGVLITDEQHRFGVNQRAALSKKGEHAHVLVMSATPIPRSLALTLYGDLDISKISEMPRGRQKIDTFVVNEGYRARLNAFIEKQVGLGGQVYVVCPSIDESEESEGGEISLASLDEHPEPLPPLKAAVKYCEELRSALPRLRIELLHGRMKGAEKDKIMTSFARGEIDVLVSTTVIEVGVNVPRATLMIVENAERFGLAQLHQLRGRVGRGERKSYCVLVSDSRGENARERLGAMKTEHDGFKIAEKDLAIRGPGDFIKGSSDPAVRQSGGIRFKIADLGEDTDLLQMATAAAAELLHDSAALGEGGALRERIEKMFSVDAYSLN